MSDNNDLTIPKPPPQTATVVGRSALGIHLSALDTWAKEKGMTNYAIAKILGCSVTAVKMWRQGQSLPNLVYACYLARLTGGAIPVEYWITTPLGIELQSKSNRYWVLREKRHRAKLTRQSRNRTRINKIRRRLGSHQPKFNQDPDTWEPGE